METPQTANTATATTTTKPVEDTNKIKIISFTGESFSITIPTTTKSLTFSKVETTRGDINNRWTYPSCLPAMEDSFKDKAERLKKYQEILGDERLIEVIEDALQRICQDTWRSCATPELEEGETEIDYSKPELAESELLKNFIESFIEGKTREGITSIGLAKKMHAARALAIKLKKANGGKDTPESIAAMAKARKWHAKYLEQSTKEMGV